MCKMMVIDIHVHLHSIQNDTFVHTQARPPLEPAFSRVKPGLLETLLVFAWALVPFPWLSNFKVFLSPRKSLPWNRKKNWTQFPSGLYSCPLHPNPQAGDVGGWCQVAKVVSISTSPQKAKTCQGIGQESRRPDGMEKQDFQRDRIDPHLVVGSFFGPNIILQMWSNPHFRSLRVDIRPYVLTFETLSTDVWR